MRILAIETSCDETGVAVVEKKGDEQTVCVLSNITATSVALHTKTGGIIPENAAREQIKYIIPLVKQALSDAGFDLKTDIDAIAVTCGPGLIGSLLVGVETAKTLSFVLNKPIIPVHHLLAHLFANFVRRSSKFEIRNSKFPFIGLIVSGGHTDLLLFESISKFKWLGGTRDDAAGEALDKIGRLLNLSYPAGSEIEQRANRTRKSSIKFKSPLIDTEDFDFSFSGLKTEVSRFIGNLPAGRQEKHLTERLINEVCYTSQDAIFAVLVKKTIRAAKLYNCSNIVLGGGVSANQTLLKNFKSSIINNKLSIKVFSPEKTFCTDNAAMIGAHALLNYKPIAWNKITAQPDLYFD